MLYLKRKERSYSEEWTEEGDPGNEKQPSKN